MATKQKEEALKRLDIMVSQGLLKEVRDTFDKKDLPYYSERMGILYWCNEEGGASDVLMNKIKELDEEGKLVYHVTHEYTDFGELYDFFYVSSTECEDEWNYDKSDMEDGYALVYVYNVDGDFGEYGSIGWRCANGGVVRTA